MFAELSEDIVMKTLRMMKILKKLKKIVPEDNFKTQIFKENNSITYL